MKFLSIYKHAERNTPPSPEEMAKMGKMVEDWMKAGKLNNVAPGEPAVNEQDLKSFLQAPARTGPHSEP